MALYVKGSGLLVTLNQTVHTSILTHFIEKEIVSTKTSNYQI